MFFIGIVSETKEFEIIRNSLKNSINIEPLNIINLNNKNMENFQNITFDTIVIMQGLEKWSTNIRYLEEIIKKSRYLLINADIPLKKEINKIKRVITFGFNLKSTVLVSSVSEDRILIDLQHSILNANNILFDSGSKYFPIENKATVHDALVIFILEMLYAKPKNITNDINLQV